jgi:nitroimidazol reductase NimA-like FMN-containing flavoprotein (pyridoxamine 5'-phosphate oxidase superfamily)
MERFTLPPIWYRFKDDVFYFVSIKKSSRVTNIKRNKNVSLSFLIQGSPAGEGDISSRCALVYGKAELRFKPEEVYKEYARWVFERYATPGSEYDPTEFDHNLFVNLKVTPDKIVHFYP